MMIRFSLMTPIRAAALGLSLLAAPNLALAGGSLDPNTSIDVTAADGTVIATFSTDAGGSLTVNMAGLTVSSPGLTNAVSALVAARPTPGSPRARSLVRNVMTEFTSASGLDLGSLPPGSQAMAANLLTIINNNS